MAEIYRVVELQYGRSRARAIVLSYIEGSSSHPPAAGGKPIKIRFPSWDRLGGEAKWYFRLLALQESQRAITDAVTVNMSNEYLERIDLLEPMRSHGPGWFVGQVLMNGVLEPVYRRAGKRLVFGYVIETHHKPRWETSDPNDREDAFSFDATVLLHVPDGMRGRVGERFAEWAGVSFEDLEKRHSGSPIYWQPIDDNESFNEGADNTGRRGLLGMGDYAAKTLPVLASIRDQLKGFGSPYAKGMRRLTWISGLDTGADRRLYEEFRAVAESSWEDVAAEFGIPAPAYSPAVTLEMAQYLRIAKGYEGLGDILSKFIAEDGLERELVARKLL